MSSRADPPAGRGAEGSTQDSSTEFTLNEAEGVGMTGVTLSLVEIIINFLAQLKQAGYTFPMC